MKLLHHVYYHASSGYPDATPAGIICIDLSDSCDFTDDAATIARTCTSVGLFDDACFQLGFTNEDADLVRGSSDNFQYVVSDQLVSDWQWDVMKTLGTFRIAEVDHESVLESMRFFINLHE